MEGRADDYRRLARECLSIARSTSAEKNRVTLIEMARIWTRLADEQAVASPPTAVVQDRPMVQQQQQVQPKKEPNGGEC
jgi:hypothetical protein